MMRYSSLSSCLFLSLRVKPVAVEWSCVDGDREGNGQQVSGPFSRGSTARMPSNCLSFSLLIFLNTIYLFPLSSFYDYLFCGCVSHEKLRSRVPSLSSTSLYPAAYCDLPPSYFLFYFFRLSRQRYDFLGMKQRHFP